MIVFFEAFKLLLKLLPDLLCRRDWFVSFSSDFLYVRHSLLHLLRFYGVTALIHWSSNTFCVQGNFPGFFVPTSFLPCCHVGMVFQCDFIVLNDRFLSPPNIRQRFAVFIVVMPPFQNSFRTRVCEERRVPRTSRFVRLDGRRMFLLRD